MNKELWNWRPRYNSLKNKRVLLERQAYIADKKTIFFDMMIDLAESEYQIDIRNVKHSSVPKKK